MRTNIDVGMNLAVVGNDECGQVASIPPDVEASRRSAFEQFFARANPTDPVYAFFRIHADNSLTPSKISSGA